MAVAVVVAISFPTLASPRTSLADSAVVAVTGRVRVASSRGRARCRATAKAAAMVMLVLVPSAKVAVSASAALAVCAGVGVMVVSDGVPDDGEGALDRLW